MWIMELLGSSVFGGLMGGVFGLLTKWQENKTLELKQNHEVNMLTAKTTAQLQLADKQIEGHKVEGELKVEATEAEAFKESQSDWRGKFGWIGASVKGVVRPAITVCMLYMTYNIVSGLDVLVGGLESIPEPELVALYKVVILQILGLTSTVVAWWYAARTSKSFDKLVGKYM